MKKSNVEAVMELIGDSLKNQKGIEGSLINRIGSVTQDGVSKSLWQTQAVPGTVFIGTLYHCREWDATGLQRVVRDKLARRVRWGNR